MAPIFAVVLHQTAYYRRQCKLRVSVTHYRPSLSPPGAGRELEIEVPGEALEAGRGGGRCKADQGVSFPWEGRQVCEARVFRAWAT